jgi:hypothetical protein
MMLVMDKRGPAGTQTFVVRVVRDAPKDLHIKRWRAIVIDVRSGERRAVTSYAELAAFIEERRRPEVTRD